MENANTPEPRSRRCSRALKWLKRIGIALIVLAAIHGLVTVILGRRYEAELDRIRARGEPMELADVAKLAGSSIPDSENAAAVYRKASALLEEKSVNREAEKLFLVIRPENAERTPSIWTDAQKAAPKLAGVMRLIEEGAARPRCYFPMKLQAGVSMDFSHYAKLRQLARVTASLAILDARRGDAAAALPRIQIGIRLSECIRQDPVVISLLVRLALIKFPTVAARELIERCPMSEAQAKKLYDAFGSIDLAPQQARALLGERACGMWMIGFIIGQSSGHKVGGYVTRPLVYRYAVPYLVLMRREIDAANVPFRELKARSLDAETLDRETPSYQVLSRMMIPVLTRARMQVDARKAQIAAVQAALALIAYKDRFGFYPKSLDEVATRLGWKLPDDPFSGKPLIYRPRAKGFAIFSIGPNMKDNGGSPASPKDDMQTKGDVVISRSI